jgi:hypothetical protein
LYFEAHRHVFFGYEQYGRFLEVHWDRLPLVLSSIGHVLWSGGWALPYLLPVAVLLLASDGTAFSGFRSASPSPSSLFPSSLPAWRHRRRVDRLVGRPDLFRDPRVARNRRCQPPDRPQLSQRRRTAKANGRAGPPGGRGARPRSLRRTGTERRNHGRPIPPGPRYREPARRERTGPPAGPDVRPTPIPV